MRNYENLCEECSTGFIYLDIIDSKYHKIPSELSPERAKCLQITSKIEGYYYNPSSGNFEKCPDRCIECQYQSGNPPVCTKCQKYLDDFVFFYLDPISLQCVSCNKTGFYWNETKEECVGCNENCKKEFLPFYLNLFLFLKF